MIARKPTFITLAAFIISLLLISTTLAQDTLLISYQGRLTDDGGGPINGTESMTFTIYNVAGVSKWTESHASVQVDDGLFSVILGSQSALPDSVFNGDDHFLGIAVGDDPELVPRTLLTATPGAAVSRRVVGDIVTAPGVLQIHPPNPCIPPDPCIPAFEASVTDSLTALTLTTRRSDPTEPTIETVIGAGDQEVDFDIIVSVPDDDDVTPVSIGTNIAAGSSHMVLSTPSGGAIVELKTDESSGSPGVTIKSEVSGYPRSGDKRLEIDEDGFIESASAWDASTGDSSWTFVATDTAGAKAEVAQKDGSGDSTVVAMQANDSISQIGLIGQLNGNRSTVDLGADASSASMFITNAPSTGTSTQIEMGALTGEAGLAVVHNQAVGESAEVKMQVNATRAELILYDSDASADPAIALRVNSDGGRIGINTNSPSEELYVVGDIIATGAITEISSAKYKTEIEKVANALDMVEGLRGVTYRWKVNEYPEMRLPDGQQVGMIAEEVESVIPELVHADENGEMSVNYSKLAAVLIEAVKEQQKQINTLTKRLEELERSRDTSR